MNKIILVSALFLLPCLSFGQIISDTSIKEDCLQSLGKYKEFWVADSLAKTGLRLVIGMEFRDKFNCLVGRNWKEAEKYLGQPHFIIPGSKFIIDSNNEIRYRFVLLAYHGYKNYHQLGNVYMDIIVVDGIIRGVFLIEVDG